MNENILEIEVLEVAGAIRIDGKKVLPGKTAKLKESTAKKLEAEGLLKILGTAEITEPEPGDKLETLDPEPKITVAPTKTAEGNKLETETAPSVPVTEEIKKTEGTEENLEVTEAEANEEAEKLVKEYTFKDLANHAKTLGLTKVVGISAIDLAKNIVAETIKNQGKKLV